MEKAGKYILWGAAIFAGVKIGKSMLLKYLKNHIHIIDFRVISIYSDKIKTQVLLSIENPLPKRLLINSLNADIWLNDGLISQVSQPINQYVFANGTTSAVINVDVIQQDLAREVWEHITSGTGTVRNWIITVNGEITVEGIKIPLDTYLVFDDFFGRK